eukprot:2733247-Pyramimonas_sp.AAC.1
MAVPVASPGTVVMRRHIVRGAYYCIGATVVKGDCGCLIRRRPKRFVTVGISEEVVNWVAQVKSQYTRLLARGRASYLEVSMHVIEEEI